MDEDCTTTGYSSNVGTDDPVSPTSPLSPRQLTDTEKKEIIASLLSEGWKGPDILTILEEEYGWKISLRTLSRLRQNWGLRLCDLMPPENVPDLLPPIRASLISAHQNGFRVAEMRSQLHTELNLDVSHRTVKRYLRRLKLKQRRDDIAEGKLTREEAVAHIRHAREALLANTAGYRRMRQILVTNYGLHLPRKTVYEILSELDPEGMNMRLKRNCKRRVFRVAGPNHIWSADGHDKLKPYGITVYGFIDAWSRKVLGIFVHVTNNDPRHVGVYLLQLAQSLGGIPKKLTTDKGTETGDMATFQIQLSHEFIEDLTPEQAQEHMHYTKSIHNQRIESLWSRMMTEHNRPVIDNILKHMEKEAYDDSDPLQKLLFVFLWVPVFQASADSWVESHNAFRKRRDKRTCLPTGVAPVFSYSNPEHFQTSDLLVPIPHERFDELLEEHYPNLEQMFTHTPAFFHDVASQLFRDMGYTFQNLAIGHVWHVFDVLLPRLKEQFPPQFFVDLAANLADQNEEDEGQQDESTLEHVAS
ncbi:hypothetical protein MJO28_002329 [Puccinia striiformis f. sp. tritici]|uniref:Uncharacterized protein n=1 Tax=Puccinia striiformis f. sp. tritici TaxID=168172 RepID=A0ACC0EY69_9BASI|nr:hypothetical protein MJO28_002329 [Puccinia striiformis f. sp. tritici]